MNENKRGLCHVANNPELNWWRDLVWEGNVSKSVNQLGVYCTFAPRRSHPQPQHYAPTTELDPSPLRGFFLLIRSLLVPDAPGSRTFKPSPDCVGHFLNCKIKPNLRTKALRQTTKGPTQGAALLQSAARKTELSQSFEDWIAGAVWCSHRLSFKAQAIIINIFPHWLQALSKRKSPVSVRAQVITCWLGSTPHTVQSESVSE